MCNAKVILERMTYIVFSWRTIARQCCNLFAWLPSRTIDLESYWNQAVNVNNDQQIESEWNGKYNVQTVALPNKFYRQSSPMQSIPTINHSNLMPDPFSFDLLSYNLTNQKKSSRVCRRTLCTPYGSRQWILKHMITSIF